MQHPEGWPGRPDPWDPELDEHYRCAVGDWLSLHDPGVIASTYDERIFPMALARMERDAASRAKHRLILVALPSVRNNLWIGPHLDRFRPLLPT